jgi:hypothetical protein
MVNLSFEIELTSIETTDGEMQAKDMTHINESQFEGVHRKGVRNATKMASAIPRKVP